MKKPLLSLQKLNKYYDNSHILKDITFDIEDGEFITFLGPSGCGKTTLLRCIAGLEFINSGDILLNDSSIKGVSPNKRNINTVFQNYSLFPHLNIYDNIAYGPRVKKSMDEKTIKEKVSEFLDLVKMAGYENRMINQLSGGQNQRIAIARALINEPNILLLDEPLGALDLKLRKHMQMELVNLQKTTKTTFVYVTHDQEEAINISDRIVVMNDGLIQQIGTPREIYNHPKNLFVAEFIGDRNIKTVEIIENNKTFPKVKLGNNIINIRCSNTVECEEGATKNAILAIHMDKMKISCDKTPNSLFAKVISIRYAGSQIRTKIDVDSEIFTVIEYQNEDCDYKIGEEVYVSWEESGAVLLPMEDKVKESDV